MVTVVRTYTIQPGKRTEAFAHVAKLSAYIPGKYGGATPAFYVTWLAHRTKCIPSAMGSRWQLGKKVGNRSHKMRRFRKWSPKGKECFSP